MTAIGEDLVEQKCLQKCLQVECSYYVTAIGEDLVEQKCLHKCLQVACSYYVTAMGEDLVGAEVSTGGVFLLCDCYRR